MKKLFMDTLAFEVTRKCLQECKFCMRGKAQNIDMSKEVVDALFFNSNYQITDIDTLFFSGGEPLLNPSIIEYIIDIIIQTDIYVDKCNLGTSGLIFEQRAIDAFDKLNEKMGKVVYGGFIYQPDQFHKEMPKEIEEMYENTKILEKCERIERSKCEIYNIGLAKINGIGERIPPNYKKPLVYYENKTDELLFYPGRKREKNHYFLPYKTYQSAYINALGYLLSGGDGEYTVMDVDNLGNILDDNIVNLSTNAKTLVKR